MKVSIIYASTTGNTQEMAEAIAQGAKSAGAEVIITNAGAASPSSLEADIIALGSPAMGDEILEEEEMEPFFSSIEDKLTGKKVALFGSYDWGDGQWMRDWEARVTKAGATLFNGEGLICNLKPEGEEREKCIAFGSALAN